jgi:hypothetical protein
MDDQTRLTYYKKSLQSAWGYNDYNDWPIKVNSVLHLFLPVFTTEFLNDLNEAESQKMPISNIIQAFENASRLYRLINPLIFGMKRLRMNIAEQRRIVLYLLDIIKQMKHGSEFNEDGVNAIISPEQVAHMAETIPFQKVDRQTAIILQRFCGIMWAYTEANFFRAHEITKEIHGPYPFGDGGEKYLIREYLHLQPTEIWSDIPFIPYQKIVIYAKYRGNLNVTIDSYNHLFLHQGNYVEDLLEYAIEADGKTLGVEQLMKTVPAMQRTIQAIHDWVNHHDWYAKVNRYADIYWFRKSPLNLLLGKDWRVSRAVRDSIMNGEPDPKRLNKLSNESIDRLISTII